MGWLDIFLNKEVLAWIVMYVAIVWVVLPTIFSSPVGGGKYKDRVIALHFIFLLIAVGAVLTFSGFWALDTLIYQLGR